MTQVTYSYDAHGRKWKETDARNGITIYTYNDADQVVTVTTPAPNTTQAAQTTTTYYDVSFRAWKVTAADGTSITNEFYKTGGLKRTYGSRTYPVAYGYDPQGRMTKMTNWTTFDAGGSGSGARVTTWNYDAYRGWLSSKRYHDSTGPDYTYTDGGRLRQRSWVRVISSTNRVLTSYVYGFDNVSGTNSHGDLVQPSTIGVGVIRPGAVRIPFAALPATISVVIPSGYSRAGAGGKAGPVRHFSHAPLGVITVSDWISP